MKCIHVSARKAAMILFSLLINGVQHTQMADNNMHLTTKDQSVKNTSNNQEQVEAPPKGNSQVQCPMGSNKTCEELGQELSVQCMSCELNRTCIYGQEYTAECRALYSDCEGEPKTFKRSYICRYCYQTESWEHTCNLKANCNSIATTRSPYTTNCTVRDDILCLGERRFNKNVLCNWTGGYRWSTALILSVTLGGFGADRFYLGHWQEGIGKLFSFGGLGVWTLIDVILISLHYLGPADGSLYI